LTAADRRRWVRPLKLAAGLLVIAAVGRHVALTWAELRARGESIRVDPTWLAAASALYVAGLVLDGIWYHRVLRATATPIGLAPALRAYLVSHLAKYVPGKAMVVVTRAAISASAGARPAAAVFATLYETLVMMGAGALVATAGYALSPSRSVPVDLGPLGSPPVSLLAVSALLTFAFLVVTAPPVFPRLAAAASAALRGAGAGAAPRLDGQLLAAGLAWSGLGWIFLGASQYAVLRALGVAGIGAAQAPALVAGVALATVAGFVVAVAPGGLGVREWVLWTSLGVVLDHERAVLSALVLRAAWLLGEIAAAGACVALGRRRPAHAHRTEHPGPAERP
jgi:uncharacterized membrane protein YbhN (UPF0104 family)